MGFATDYYNSTLLTTNVKDKITENACGFAFSAGEITFPWE